MQKNKITDRKKIKQILAFCAYGISAIMFGLFVFYIVHPRYRFDVLSTLFFSVVVCGALIIGTYFLTNTTSDFAKKRKIIRKTIILLFLVYVVCLTDLLFFQNRFISEIRFDLTNLELRANFGLYLSSDISKKWLTKFNSSDIMLLSPLVMQTYKLEIANCDSKFAK